MEVKAQKVCEQSWDGSNPKLNRLLPCKYSSLSLFYSSVSFM